MVKNASIYLLNIPFYLSASTVSIWIHFVSNWYTKTSSSKTSPRISAPQYRTTPFSTPTPPIHSSTTKNQFQSPQQKLFIKNSPKMSQERTEKTILDSPHNLHQLLLILQLAQKLLKSFLGVKWIIKNWTGSSKNRKKKHPQIAETLKTTENESFQLKKSKLWLISMIL